MSNHSSEKLKVVQIGVGRFGAKRRALMRETGLFKLEAAFDWDKEALAKAVEEDGAVAARSYEELLDTPGIEAVIVSTGAKFHAEQVHQALDRGLHVFVEKPLCSSQEDMLSLLEAQQRTGLVIGMGHVRHSTDAMTRTIQCLIESGELGRVLAVEDTVAHSGGWHIPSGGWRGDREANPGGMLFHCGVHEIHELTYLFGPISHVYATIRYDVHDTDTADGAQCLFTFESGLTATLSTYHVTAYQHSMRFFGTEASLYREQGEDTIVRLFKQQRHPRRQREYRELVELPERRDETGNLRSFHEAIRFGTEPESSILDGVRALTVVFAALESAETGNVVRVEQPEAVLA